MIEIDGSKAGGQVLRTALSLSALTNTPFKIKNIRGIKKDPGLRQQHLVGIKALKDLCNAEVKHANLHSTKLEFYPKKIKGGNLNINVGTAGSTTLILQTLIPPCIHEESTTTINITGGTDTKFCPGSHYFRFIFLDLLKRMNIKTDFEILKYGFFPKGGGKFKIEIPQNINLKTLTIEKQKTPKKIQVHAVASQELAKAKVAERLIKNFRLKTNFDINLIKTKKFYVNTLSTGCFLYAHTEYDDCRTGVSCLGEKGIPSEKIAHECALDLQFETSGKGLDHNAADQMMIYMALKGKGLIKTSRIGQHVKTNAPIIEKFLPVNFNINEKENIIKCSKI